jgi:hypothetical protein
LVSHRPSSPEGDPPVIEAGHDQVAGTRDRPGPQPDLRASLDEAVVQEVVADAAGQLAGMFLGAVQEQRVLPAEVVGEPPLPGQVHHLLGVAAQPALLVMDGQDRHARAQPQSGVALPALSEPNRPAELDESELAGEHHHAAALHAAELLMIASDQDPAVPRESSRLPGVRPSGVQRGGRPYRGLVVGILWGSWSAEAQPAS